MSPDTPAEPWRPSRIVTLLTDFGQRDPYVGIMKVMIARPEQGLAAAGAKWKLRRRR
ncbi:MAG: SAM-dependent chlorinase/fluorinase [Planctomycetota bacterium]|nr:SAM-dependent chlorinase/fluorinase [Planctomycetota bacterium]